MNRDTERLHSLVIPTRNRARTAEAIVRKVLSFMPRDAEVVVQDCSDSPLLGARLSDLIDGDCLVYGHVDKPLSMTDNWNLALPRCRGRYVTLIGDDDGIGFEFYDAVRWMEANGIECAVNRSPSAQFFWPDYSVTGLAGTCSVRPFTGRVEHVPVRAHLARATGAFSGEAILVLPKLYQGIVREDVVSRMRLPDGRYFRSITPDYYSMFRLASLVERVAVVDFPLVIPGACGGSNNSDHSGSATRECKRHLSEFQTLGDWPSVLPLLEARSAALFMAEGMVLALKDGGMEGHLKGMNIELFYFLSLYMDRGRARENLARFVGACRELRRPVPVALIRVLREAARYGIAGLKRRARAMGLAGGVHGGAESPPLRGLADIGEAIDALQDLVDSQGVEPPWAAGGGDRRGGRPGALEAHR